jgi:hypothetical protein
MVRRQGKIAVTSTGAAMAPWSNWDPQFRLSVEALATTVLFGLVAALWAIVNNRESKRRHDELIHAVAGFPIITPQLDSTRELQFMTVRGAKGGTAQLSNFVLVSLEVAVDIDNRRNARAWLVLSGGVLLRGPKHEFEILRHDYRTIEPVHVNPGTQVRLARREHPLDFGLGNYDPRRDFRQFKAWVELDDGRRIESGWLPLRDQLHLPLAPLPKDDERRPFWLRDYMNRP